MFSERIIRLRKETNMTQSELAKKLGIPRTTYSNYENGNRQPDYETLQKIANYFGVSSDYLIGMSDTSSNVVKENKQEYFEDKYGPVTEEEKEELAKHLQYLRWKANNNDN